MFQLVKAMVVGTGAVALLAGCSTVGVTSLKSAPSKPAGCPLQVFMSTDDLKADGRAYEALCMIDVKTGAGLPSERTMAAAINLARPKACECGADALVLQESPAVEVGASGILKAIRWKMPVAP